MKKKIDPRLVGVWQGINDYPFLVNEISRWTTFRKADGTFYVSFASVFFDGMVEKFVRQGVWFTEGNLYYEEQETEDGTEITCLGYRVLSENKIQFKERFVKYDFIDTKIRLH